MTELELYKFIEDNDVEWHRADNNGIEDILIMPYTFELTDFDNLVRNYIRDDGISCVLKNGYVCIWMNELCEYYGIEIDNVFKIK